MSQKTNRAEIDFLGKRYIFAGISAALVLASLVLLVVPGPKYGIDFAGGTNIIVRFNEHHPIGDVRTAVEGMGFEDAAVQEFGAEGNNQYLISTSATTTMNEERRTALTDAIVGLYGEDTVIDFDEAAGDRIYSQLPESAYEYDGTGDDYVPTPEEHEANKVVAEAAILAALQEAGFDEAEVVGYGAAGDRRFDIRVSAVQGVVTEQFVAAFGEEFGVIDRVETVGPRVGQQLRDDGIKAVLFALIAILLYIAVRFDLRYAPGAVLALFHDVMITMGIFVILQQEISLPIIAALLTIVGYSLNDTIVNFDRVRENIQLTENPSNILGLVNRSVNECLSRTVLTSVTTLIAVVIIFLFGGGLIRSFALAMIIGVIVGTYSSIYVASPVLVWTSNWLDERRKAREATEALA